MLAIRICGTNGQSRPGKVKRGLSTRARESFRMALWRLFRVRQNFLSYSLRRLGPRRHVLLSQKCGLPQDGHARLRFGWTLLTGKSMFARPKMIAPSWPKVVADGQDVATRGLSIGLLLASTDDIMELLLLLLMQHRRKKPLLCHVIYTCNINQLAGEPYTNSSCIQDIGIVAR